MAPNNFLFVMPRELADQVEIPKWAGLITVVEYEYGGKKRVASEMRKKAPRIHTKKVESDWERKLFQNFYWRYWRGKTS